MPEKPSNESQQLFTAFKEAVEAEKSAQNTYLHLKELTDDELLKQILEGFYQDEVRHERELVARYKELRHKMED